MRTAVKPAVLAAVAAAMTLLAAAPASAAPRASAADPPNVLVVMTDDQDIETMRAMPIVDALLADEGVEFRNSFASFPLCCPSRATFLTGQYALNHGVRDVAPPAGGYGKLDHTNTLPVWLQAAGYYTGHIGKYLNGYGTFWPAEVPPGWSEWHGSIDPWTYVMYGYRLYEGGQPVTYGGSMQAGHYQTDLYSAKAEEFIRQRAPLSQPFFLQVAVLAPHAENGNPNPNPRPAPRHLGAYTGETLPRPPSFDEENVSDKPRFVRDRERLPASVISGLTDYYRARLASLLAVDDLVANLYGALAETGELDNTLIIFTSDNGQLQGEHRLYGKDQVYEGSVRVPLIMRGPGIPRGVRRSQLAANVDLAPTILDYAGARAGLRMDGISLRPLIADPMLEPGRGILLEGRDWTGVRTNRYVNVDYKAGDRELYDLATDPHQLDNSYREQPMRDERKELNQLLGSLRDCNGRKCRDRPALRLRASGCGAKATATVTGRERGDVVRARFFAGKRRLGKDAKPPFSTGVAGRRGKLSAVVTLEDGRLFTLRRKLKAC